MKKTLPYLFFIFICLYGKLSSQTYQLTGSPVINTTGWDLVSNASATSDFVQLTQDVGNQFGVVKLATPINLKYCDKWKVEFDFRIDGNGTTQYGRGDGFTFWYLSNPPTGFTGGGGLGIPSNANGLMVGFDIFNNTTEGQMSKIHVLYGTNNLPAGNNNIEYNNTAGSTFHSADLNPTQPFVGSAYKHVEVNGEMDAINPNIWHIKIQLDGVVIADQPFTASGGAVGMTTGYFGFSAATGGASARHSIKNAKIYIDKVPILTNTITPFVCVNPATGNGTVDLTSFQNQFVTTPANYQFTYFGPTGTPITNPTNYQYSTGTTNITVVVKDPSSTLCDNGDGKIVLTPSPFAANDVTLTGCDNNNAGGAVFNLTAAALSSVPGSTAVFYNTMYDLNNHLNPITNPSAYLSPAAVIYAQVTTPQGCTDVAQVTLNLFPVVVVQEATLRSCAIETNPSTALFNLTTATVTSQPGTKTYFPSMADAQNGTNAILNFNNYISPNGVVYIKVTNGNGCYSIAKVNLIVIPQVFSNTLEDKIICMEDTTTLDAGPGFTGYEWSTGATTRSITNVSVGTYWVKLKTGNCIATQTVKVYASQQPVITSVDISSTTVTVYVNGGTAPYKYSLDGISWQDSNEFKNMPRGDSHIYVKDAYDCDPVNISIVVPNLINVITPNGDGVNDAIDYSALAGKQNLVFNVFDRYGAKIHQADKSNRYKWDGTVAGRKVPTGSYWYSVSWNENDKKSTPIKYSGWILVKNRD
ncbi:gliding motility-associated C-terminal domain-containing protein [Chryseobacterium arachidis]|uniref:Gliding motility-associated C-terminal domain-containing protein n=1 Tax=Chryseobacterium arachidis TaxID=1416778 RepID=A0A1M4XL01_9FLAO|nr:T9SS type B sorting domain-containing protein [Chryseobacterium arachidis]SHE94175.1 gliding motility-associated C-terminal domain-containing protein [Chryseobacterium arachidis]